MSPPVGQFWVDINRTMLSSRVYPGVPPKVEYALTDEGRTIGPILLQLNEWGAGWHYRRDLREKTAEAD